MNDINISIDRIVIDTTRFSTGDRDRFDRAFRTALIAQSSNLQPEQLKGQETSRKVQITLPKGGAMTPEMLGENVAGALIRGITQ